MIKLALNPIRTVEKMAGIWSSAPTMPNQEETLKKKAKKCKMTWYTSQCDLFMGKEMKMLAEAEE